MKKYLSYLGASLVAIAALSSCNKELADPNEGKTGAVPFEISASSIDTRTENDGLSTKWVAGDAINLFHAAAGTTTYTSDGQFTITSENLAANKFTGTLAAALEAGNYDWYAFYPYSNYNTTPAGSSESDFGYTKIGGTSQTQTGNNSTAHLCGKPCPLYGVATAVASDVAPSIVMNHLTSIVEVNVTNNSGKELTVSSVSFTGTEDIVGTYYINFTQTPVVYTSNGETYVSNTATLNVTNGEAIANGSSAKFYIAIKPFTVSSDVLKIAVNGYEKEIKISKETVFAAGKIKKINFNFDKVVADYVTLPWVEDFSENLGIYALVNGQTDTKTYDAKLAGGTAPELLVSNTNGSFSAKVKASVGNYVLTFKSNHADYLSISIDNEAITLTKESDTVYSLSIPDGVDFFRVTFTNTSASNTRLDDISLKADERTTLTTPVVIASLNSDTLNSIDVMWDPVDYAGSYVVTATPETGRAVSKTVTADESTLKYECTITGLYYETAYTISVVAKPSDTSLYLDSAAGEAESVTTGASGGVTPTDVTFDFTKISDFSTWNSTYSEHTVEYDEGVVTFASANKQTSTITDQPVSKGGDLTLVMNNSQTINSLEFTCTKWNTKAQTITLNTSTDGGDTWTKTTNTSSNFVLTVDSLPEGVNAIKFTFSSTSNQIGYKSLKINYNKI